MAKRIRDVRYVGAKLRERREAAGFVGVEGAEEVARALGKSTRTILNWEQDATTAEARPPRPHAEKDLPRLAVLYNCTVNDFYSDETSIAA